MSSWACDREVFYIEADKLRADFENNRHVTDRRALENILRRGEQKLWQFAHPDPYTIPYSFGGSLYARNPPWDERLHRQPDFGREADALEASLRQGQIH
ncbi:hypothetical protein WJX73_005051 [Symbiochloris irregularis]|uniref:NADH dehydrogenase [ubiquinone] 1 beta subcomplex subunit 9 n=1 Tax=Symbiochloris irregularis TaxID=706552 RepID=A0AAW1NI59_9CHLO